MNRKTYNELGVDSLYRYQQHDVGRYKRVVISNSISSLNVVDGVNNDIRNNIYAIDNIGSNVEELYEGCFSNCPHLNRINLGENIKIIGRNAFSNCSNLTSFKNDTFCVPLKLGDNAFENCDFKKIIFKRNNYGPIDEDGGEAYQIMIDGDVFLNNTNLSSVEMDDIMLGNNMFRNCTSLKSVTIHEGASTIYCDSSPFEGCNNLLSLSFPASISSYYMLHGETLKGSNISALYMTGMTEDEVKFAVGYESGKRNRVLFEPPTETEDIKLGTVYKFDNDEKDSMQSRVDNFIAKLVNNHIPTFMIECGD